MRLRVPADEAPQVILACAHGLTPLRSKASRRRRASSSTSAKGSGSTDGQTRLRLDHTHTRRPRPTLGLRALQEPGRGLPTTACSCRREDADEARLCGAQALIQGRRQPVFRPLPARPRAGQVDDAALGDPAADGLRRDVRTLGGDDDRHAVRKRLLDPLAERLRQDRGASHGLTRPVVSRGAHIAYSAARRGFQGSVDTRARSKNRQPPMPTSQRLASSNLEILRSPAPRRGSETLGAAAQQIFWTSSPFCPFVRPLARGLVLPTTVPAGV
jgi:hypothetical protein